MKIDSDNRGVIITTSNGKSFEETFSMPSACEKEVRTIACKIGDYVAVDAKPMATVIHDDKKIAECYTNEDAEFIANILRDYACVAELERRFNGAILLIEELARLAKEHKERAEKAETDSRRIDYLEENNFHKTADEDHWCMAEWYGLTGAKTLREAIDNELGKSS